MIPGIKKKAFNFHDLLGYVALAGKHLRLMTLLVCMCLLAGLAIYVYSRPVYFSRSLVQVDSLSLPMDTDKVYHDGNIVSVIAQLKSATVMERTAKVLGVVADHREIEDKYLRKIVITTTSTGNLEVDVYSYVKDWPARWTEIMVEEFMKLREEQREAVRNEVVKAYGEEMGHLNQKIDQNQDSKFAFESQSKFTEATIDLNRIKELPGLLVQTTQRIEKLDLIRHQLDAPDLDVVSKLSLIESSDETSPIKIGQIVQGGAGGSSSQASGTGTEAAATEIVVPSLASGMPEWHKLEMQQRGILRDMDDLSTKYLPTSLKITALHKQLEQVQRQLQLEYDGAKARFDLEYQTQLQKKRDLEAKLPEYREVTRRYEKIQQDSQLHDAGQLAWNDYYSAAERRINELEYTADREKVNLQFLQLVDAKSDPVSPNAGKLLGIAFVLGLLLAVGVPFLIEYLDFTLSNIEEVEATFQLRGLGIIPQVPHEVDHPVLIGSEGDDQNLVENFRVVRTNLLSMGALSKPAQVTMVTSSMPREGKTVVSSNLAISFGQMGVRTLLIDTDMRRGRLHRLFGFRKSPGLSDYLLGKVSLDEAIRPSEKDNLMILSAGEHVESGTELLGSPRFAELMSHLRGRFERIVVDTPPVLGLSETSILQSHVDGVLFVIWSGRTPIRNMKTAIDVLQANGANFYGFILNRLDLTETTNYYQYYYYSSDYYHSYRTLENV